MATASEDLQTAIYDALIADAAVGAVVGTRIVDGAPDVYPAITFGPSDYVVDDMDCVDGREETLQLDCWVRDSSQRLRPAKDLADKVKSALNNAELNLATHALATLQVVSVRAMMDPDGETGHGIVTVQAVIEERTA